MTYTITTNKYSYCVFTSKVLRFCAMMKRQGFEVFDYEVKTYEVEAMQHIELMTFKEWNALRIQSYQYISQIVNPRYYA